MNFIRQVVYLGYTFAIFGLTVLASQNNWHGSVYGLMNQAAAALNVHTSYPGWMHNDVAIFIELWFLVWMPLRAIYLLIYWSGKYSGRNTSPPSARATAGPSTPSDP